MKNLNRLFFALSYSIPILVVFSIWYNEINHYYIFDIYIDDDTLNKSRIIPNNSTFKDLQTFHYGLKVVFDDNKHLISSAEKILNGHIEIPGLPFMQITIPLAAEDIDKGLPAWQLHLAGFAIPDILLRAYQLTGREDFFGAARDIILAWASLERKAWRPRGFLWNDHAIAARVLVLAEFWGLYRQHSSYNSLDAKSILLFVSRSGEMLAKSSHFTFATNHGIMQNLALWHISLAFPSLPNVEYYKSLALTRMQDQMLYYLNDEGIILEHSAGYQLMGLSLINMAFKYLILLNIPIPSDWQIKYARAEDFYKQIRRPDGSLPIFGDTDGGKVIVDPLISDMDVQGYGIRLPDRSRWPPPRPQSLYPVAGYSIWWDGLNAWPEAKSLSQTVITWSYFPGHAHKHADEMSILLWSGGQTWWTNIGYWPYGVRGRLEAESWAASNAPHLLDESAHSMRETRLLFYAWSDSLNIIDLERTGPRKFIARRQAIHLKPDLWLIIDNAYDHHPDHYYQILWTTTHDVNINTSEIKGIFNLQSNSTGLSLTKFIAGYPNIEIQLFYGSIEPFAGWQILNGKVYPAPAIAIKQRAENSWIMTVWSLNRLNNENKFVNPPYMKYWENPENWRVIFPIENKLIDINRDGREILVKYDHKSSHQMKVLLMKGPEVGTEIEKIREAFKNSSKKYRKFKDISNYRMKITKILAILYMLEKISLVIIKKLFDKYYRIIQITTICLWVILGIYLELIYLRV